MVAVEVLHLLAAEGVHAAAVEELLNQSEVWRAYKDQQHDLFLPAGSTDSQVGHHHHTHKQCMPCSSWLLIYYGHAVPLCVQYLHALWHLLGAGWPCDYMTVAHAALHCAHCHASYTSLLARMQERQRKLCTCDELPMRRRCAGRCRGIAEGQRGDALCPPSA